MKSLAAAAAAQIVAETIATDSVGGLARMLILPPQQETWLGVLRAFLGTPCEFGDDCAYPGLGWRCGHRRAA